MSDKARLHIYLHVCFRYGLRNERSLGLDPVLTSSWYLLHSTFHNTSGQLLTVSKITLLIQLFLKEGRNEGKKEG